MKDLSMEEIVRRTLLYDFYGDLLTEHQQTIYEAVVLNDSGYSEVAQEEGITRQGVHDMIRRCDRQLEAYESKLGLMKRFLEVKELVRKIETCAAQGQALETGGPDEEGRQLFGRIGKLCEDILEQL